jgi:putative peptidoglycan lipid II flippase
MPGEMSGERQKLARRAGIVGLGTLLSRVLGLARDVSLAAVFTREETDAFWVAFRLPNMLRQVLAEGAVSSAVVPVLAAKLEEEGDDAGKAFFARMRGVSLLALLVATLLGMVFARQLCEVFAPGYHARPGEFERTVRLTRVIFPYIFFMGSAALGTAALNAKRRFAVAAFAPGLLNVAFVVATFTLPAVLVARGIDGVQALAIGALVGGVLQVVAQWPALREIGYLARPVLDVRDPTVRGALRRIGPIVVGTGIYYVDLAISSRFLSELGTGAQSYFMWAMRLCDFPQGIFVMALSTAALPSLSALAAKGDKEELVATFAHGMRLALFVAIPASVALVMMGEPIVVALFERGEFDSHAAARRRARSRGRGGPSGRSRRCARPCRSSTQWATRARPSS